MLKFGQDVVLRCTKKLELFFAEKVCRRGATHFFIRENWVFCKNRDFSYKKVCSAVTEHFFGEKTSVFPHTLGLHAGQISAS